jgi:hypothetical protein
MPRNLSRLHLHTFIENCTNQHFYSSHRRFISSCFLRALPTFIRVIFLRNAIVSNLFGSRHTSSFVSSCPRTPPPSLPPPLPIGPPSISPPRSQSWTSWPIFAQASFSPFVFFSSLDRRWLGTRFRVVGFVALPPRASIVRSYLEDLLLQSFIRSASPIYASTPPPPPPFLLAWVFVVVVDTSFALHSFAAIWWSTSPEFSVGQPYYYYAPPLPPPPPPPPLSLPLL